MNSVVCKVETCEKEASRGRRGWCRSHYERWLRHGDPLKGRFSYVRGTPEERFWAKVDKGGPDECWEWTGTKDRFGYGILGVPREGTGRYWNMLAHRFSVRAWVRRQDSAFGRWKCEKWRRCDPRRCSGIERTRKKCVVPTFGSLFAGIGGLDLGLERAGWECKWQVEVDDYCQRILAKHWPDVPRYGDIREVHDLPPVDLVCGGFPCQDISNAGPRTGIEGARSGLWGEMARVIGEVRPRYVLVENVAALAVRGLGRVLADLHTLGFDAEWSVVHACAFGAPHPRARLFLVAHPPGEGLEGWSEPEAPRTVRSSVAGIPLRTRPPWTDGPEIPRVGYGLPDWVDRVKSLGNSAMPQIAEAIGRKLLDVA